MENINESEQWKLQGDCSKCRRESYCNKRCSAVKNRVKRAVYGVVNRYAEQMLPDGIKPVYIDGEV